MDNRLNFLSVLLIFALITLVGCNSGGGGSPAPAPKPSTTYSVSGTVSNLAGTGLVLQDNGGDNLTVSSNGKFTFATALKDGAIYNVTVFTQPSNSNQLCTVVNGSGIISDSNISDIQISCNTLAYTIGGSVTGLTGAGLILENNNTDNLSVNANGQFTFSSAITDGTNYNVTVLTQPNNPNQTCVVTNGSGKVSGGNVTGIHINCATNTYSISGTISGLAGSGLVLQNNSVDDLTINANGNFTFGESLLDGTSYDVTVATQPSGQSCSVSNGTGTVNGGNITNVEVTCISPPATPAMPSLSYGVKTFLFSWPAVSGATYYQLLENPDGTTGYTAIGGNIVATTYTNTLNVPLWERLNASYVLQACNAAGCSANSTAVFVSSNLAEAIGYFKASNTGTNGPYDWFGFSVALSSDGNTLAVSALLDDSAAKGINGNQANSSADAAGAVYVFTHTATNWTQQAYIKASNTGAGDRFGGGLALSADGNTLAVGAYREDSAATGIGGDQQDNSTTDTGAVYIFTRTGSTWAQQAYIKASNPDDSDLFGDLLALSADGSTLAAGVPGEDSAATGIGGDQTDNTAADSGAVYVFTQESNVWSQQAYIKASNTDAGDQFGHGVALSADGNILAVGALYEDSVASGIEGDQNDNSALDSGAVYVFTRANSTWSQQTYIKASNAESGDNFGKDVELSADGNTLVVAAPTEDSNATGINGDENDNSATNSGAVYVFTHKSNVWSQQAYIKASNTDAGDVFGGGSNWWGITISGDGNTLAVAALNEDSAAIGIDGDQFDNSATKSGAVYVFNRDSSTWSQRAYIKASNTEAGDSFGEWHGISLSADGNSLAVGAYAEDSSATGIGGNQVNNGAAESGAVYLY